MKQRNLFISSLLLTGFLFVFAGCKTTQITTATDLKKRNARYLVNQMDQQAKDYEWFSTKGKLKFTAEGKSQSANLLLRMRKDSMIWLTLSKVGYEAARVQITPDSVHILLRKPKEYYARSIFFLEEEYGLEADFNTLQDIILGNALPINRKKAEAKLEPPHYLLTSKDNQLDKHFKLDGNYQLAQMIVDDPRTKRTLDLILAQYKLMTGGPSFSHERFAKVSEPGQEDVELKLNFNKVEVNVPKTMPFSISRRYSRK